MHSYEFRLVLSAMWVVVAPEIWFLLHALCALRVLSPLLCPDSPIEGGLFVE